MYQKPIVFMVRIDPTEFEGQDAPLSFLKKCCDGCRFEYSDNGSYEEKVGECLYCMEHKLEPAYKKQVPFDFDRETRTITYHSKSSTS